MTTSLEIATQVLRDGLMRGQFDANGKLREQSLAQELGISRTVVRLALGEVEREGLVVREPNKGFRVRSFTIEEVRDAILVRGQLEGMAARLCAENGLPDATISKCRALLLQLETLLSGGLDRTEERIAWIDLNATFHDVLIEASGNRFLAPTISSLSKIPLVSSRAIVFDARDHELTLERLTAAQTDHRNIFDAICQRQGGRAEYLMQEHARKSAQNKRLGFDAMRRDQQSPALPGLALVSNSA